MLKFKLFYIAIVHSFFATWLTAAEIDSFTIVSGSHGGGWELTAQSAGNTLVSLNLANSFKIKTLEGGAGWRALEMFLTDDDFKEELLVQSEPLISGVLNKRYRKGFRDLKPVSLVAAEYTCVIVAYDSPYKDFSDVLAAIKKNPAQTPIFLGGRRGAGDHLTANMIFSAAGFENTSELRYVFSDGGDQATVSHLANLKSFIGVTGYNSVISEAVNDKKVRIIGLTSSESIDGHRS